MFLRACHGSTACAGSLMTYRTPAQPRLTVCVNVLTVAKIEAAYKDHFAIPTAITGRRSLTSMDPLSITANIVTVLQLANSILSVCYEYRAALQKAPWSLTRVVDEVKDLRNLLENVEHVVEPLDEGNFEDTKRLRTFAILCDPESGPLIRCHQELALLERKIVSSYGIGRSTSKRKAFIQVMGWQLREHEAKECLERIDRCKSTILLAMTADEAAVLKEIRDLGISIDYNIQCIGLDVSNLVSDIQNTKLSMTHHVMEKMLFTHIDIDEAGKAITKWLAPIDSFDNHERVAKAHHPGTGTWFLNSKVFEHWRTSDNSCLWISGFRE